MGEEKFLIDTHVLIWIHSKKYSAFSQTAKEILRKSKLYYSPISVLKLQYLDEKGRLDYSRHEIIAEINKLHKIQFLDILFSEAIQQSLDLSWTRDVFDRLLVGHAIALEMPLLTKDRTIRANFNGAVW